MGHNDRRRALRALYALPLAVVGAMAIKRARAGEHAAGSGMDPDMAARLAALEARQQITEILYRYARGWDRLDEDALRSCFFADSDHQHGAFTGKSQDFITKGLPFIREKTFSTSHLITNPMIEVHGDAALSECLFLAHHRRLNKDGTAEEDYFLKGRYLDRFEKRDGVWRIAFRRGVHDFERVMPRADVTLGFAPQDQLSARKPDDPLYEMRAVFHAGE